MYSFKKKINTVMFKIAEMYKHFNKIEFKKVDRMQYTYDTVDP